MRIGYAIFLSFFILLSLFSIVTYQNGKLAGLVQENSEAFAQSSTVVRESNRFQRNVLNIASALRGYVLSNEATFIQSYDSAVAENERIIAELDTLVMNDAQQFKLLQEITELNNNWVNELAQPLLEAKKSSSSSDSGRFAFQKLYRAVVLTGHVKEAQVSIQEKSSQFTNNEYVYREIKKQELATSIARTRRISYSLTIISIIAGFTIAVFQARYISKKIVKTVKMANDIAGGNYNVSLQPDRSTEFNQLASALNNMANILSQHIALLNAKNEELDQFAHIVSHDLKAPLRGIDNVVTWMEEDSTLTQTQKMSEYLSIIKGRIKRAENLLQGILLYSRVGREKPEFEVVDVNKLIDEVRETLPETSTTRLEITTVLPVIMTEQLALLQVFSNLIVNAFKHHDKPDGFVKVYHEEHEDHFEFFVEDNGPGIAPNYHDRIFAIFQTLRERDAFESTGVGLAIVKKILDDRNLKIKLKSEPGRGSIFSFEWPKNQKP
jgi:signal transduction histidine kinase